jgi:hypothetical protein
MTGVNVARLPLLEQALYQEPGKRRSRRIRGGPAERREAVDDLNGLRPKNASPRHRAAGSDAGCVPQLVSALRSRPRVQCLCAPVIEIGS